jgi:hypothetical protein
MAKAKLEILISTALQCGDPAPTMGHEPFQRFHFKPLKRLRDQYPTATTWLKPGANEICFDAN